MEVPSGKGVRTVYLSQKLCEELRAYCFENHILRGSIFITRNANPMDPANINKNLKKICAAAKVEPQKVFPQNFKNLYMRTYREMQREIVDRMGL